MTADPTLASKTQHSAPGTQHSVGTQRSRAEIIGLKRAQVSFLLYLENQPSATRAEYQLLAGVARQTAQNELAELVQRGLIVRIGSSVASRYILQSDLDPAQHLPES